MNERGKIVDTTFLSIDNAEDRGFIHRDYIAHCLRWTHFVKRMYERKTYEKAIILDVGCGRELPLAKLLYSSKLSPRRYFGVDAGPILDEELQKVTKTGKFPITCWEKTNVLNLTDKELETEVGDGETCGEILMPNFVTCFEVLEHVEPKMMIDMLEHLKLITSDDCRFFFSTPCWNRTDCAANHVNEMLYDALGSVFEKHGFVVEHVYGTFASIRDYEHRLGVCASPGRSVEECNLRDIFDRLREYYDTNFLSCIFAPLFPAQSRNVLWELRKGEVTLEKGGPRFRTINEIPQPWGSSSNWQDMAL